MTQAPGRHTIKVPECTSDDNPYVLLVQAIVCRAVADAQGLTSPARHIPSVQIQREAQEWLAEGGGLAELLETAGLNADPLVRLIGYPLKAGHALLSCALMSREETYRP